MIEKIKNEQESSAVITLSVDYYVFNMDIAERYGDSAEKKLITNNNFYLRCVGKLLRK